MLTMRAGVPNRCHKCGHVLQAGVFPYLVTFEDGELFCRPLEGTRCPFCGNANVSGQTIADQEWDISMELALQAVEENFLASDRLLFIRHAALCSPLEFADAIGVKAEDILSWENGFEECRDVHVLNRVWDIFSGG